MNVSIGTAVSRRGLLGGAVTTAALVGLSQLTGERSDAAPPLSGYPFTLGVGSGDPRSDGVVLWTRLAPQPLADDGLGGMPRRRVPVRWEVAEDDAMHRVVSQGVAVASPELAHSVHVEVTGLRPGRHYWYRFTVGSAESTVGRTKTAPAAGALTPIALAYASCQAWDSGFYTAYRDMAKQDLDLIAHLGDYIYENGISATGGSRKTPLSCAHGSVTKTLSQYRLRHSLVNSDPDLQAARAVAPWIVNFDDHDVEDNWAGNVSPTGMSTENFLRRRAAAFRAYFENLPLRPSSMPSGPDMPIYHAVQYGRLANFYVLDERQFRSPENIAARDDPSRSILGMAQERWLLDRAGRSQTTWNVLANQVMMFQLDRLTDPGLQQLNPDSWDGYAASRDRILGGMAQRGVANPIVITGDAHVNCAADLKADFNDPGSATIGSEFLGTSITSGNDGYDMSAGGQEWLDANPHLKFFNGQRGYVKANITKDAWHTDYVVMSKVTVPDGTASIRRSFVVEAGRPGLQDA